MDAVDGECLHVVQGKRIEVVDGRELRPAAAVCARVNASILNDPAVVARLSLSAAGKQSLEARLTAAYAAAGIQVAITQTDLGLATSWARRLGAGRPMRVLASTARSSLRGERMAPRRR